MLTVLPPPRRARRHHTAAAYQPFNPTAIIMDCRGRSRGVSPIAVARRAAEDRRNFFFGPDKSRPPNSNLQLASAPRNDRPHPPALRVAPVNTPVAPPEQTRDASSSRSLSRKSPSRVTVASVSPPTATARPEPPRPTTPLFEYASSDVFSDSDDASESSSASDLSYYDSPPSPRQSLQDQMHDAYALDDYHLARILFLKFKGIEVTSPDDPRIAQVRDEDFEEVFAPKGIFKLEEKEEQRVREGRMREKIWREERTREERLRWCERIWEESRDRMREEKRRLAKERIEREAQLQRQREALERERQELERMKPYQIPRVLSYDCMDTLHASVSRTEEPYFRYSVPTLPSASSPKARRRELAAQQSILRADARSVAFKTVLKSMQGSLFPVEAESSTSVGGGSSLNTVTSYKHTSRSNAAPLESLLKVVEWEEGERRKIKGKDVVRTHSDKGLNPRLLTRTDSGGICAACSASSTSTSASRSGSWLSFGSRSSTSTALTSVSSSPSSMKKCPSPTPMFTSTSSSYSCPHRQPSQLTPVSASESPLALPDQLGKANSHRLATGGRTLPYDAKLNQRNSSSVSGDIVKRVSSTVEAFVDIAKGFQKAYVRATLFSVMSLGGEDVMCEPDMVKELMRKVRRGSAEGGRMLRPHGYRALPKDVNIFIASADSGSGVTNPSSNSSPSTNTSIPYTLIPLTAPLPRPSSLNDARNSPTATYVPPSPFRSRSPSAMLEWRLRPIGNPVLLRLKALQNMCCSKQVVWEGHARDGALGCGRERLIGIAWEGRMRSGLSIEMRVGEIL